MSIRKKSKQSIIKKLQAQALDLAKEIVDKRDGEGCRNRKRCKEKENNND